MRHSTLLILALLLVSVRVSAQNDDDDVRRWAIDAQVGGNIVQSATSNNTDVPKYRSGSTSNSGLLTKLHVEYYLPKTSFSLKAGYEREQLNFLKGDGCNELNQLMLGGRWYPSPTHWKVAPYVGADILYAIDADRGPFEMSSYMSWSYSQMSKKTYSYVAQGIVNVPRFSLGPVVGADIYLFSSVALKVEYGCRLGLDAHYRVSYTEDGSNRSSEYHGQLHRHVFTIGLKVTFPFRWTSDDWCGLLQGVIDNL